jgi:hypothetical protein
VRFSTDRLLFFDIEANGLTPDTVWCININGVDYSGHTLYQAIRILSGSESTLVGHNILGYDLPVLAKLYGLEYNVDNCYDTAIMSRLLRPDRKGHGKPHSLEEWGGRVGIAKLPDLDWMVWDEGMSDRCAVDVEITKAVYYTLRREQSGHDWTFSAWIEHWIAHYHSRQESNGVAFNREAAILLADEIQERADTVIAALKSRMPWINENRPRIKAGKSWCPNPTKAFNKDGSVPSAVMNWMGERVGGSYTKVEFKEPNPNSDPQLKALLHSLGWTPDEWNYVKDASGKPKRPLQISSPKISKSSLLPLGETGELVRQRGMLQHRLSLLRNRTDPTKGLVNNVRADGRVVAGGIPMGTPTGRYTHYGVVNIPKANDPTKEYGTEIRSLFCAADGRELAGSDADKLEANMEAHYTFPFDKGVYAAELIEGDVHQKNADIWKVTRTIAKNGKYCLSYGGQAPKLANTLGLPPKLGQKYFDMFWDGNYALKQLKLSVERALAKGHLKGLDGRKLYIRSKHSALNLLFQSAGSITVKLATIYMNQALDEAGYTWWQVIHMHDEFLNEFEIGQDKEAIDAIVSECWQRAGTTLNINVPITGETQWGSTWADCH